MSSTDLNHLCCLCLRTLNADEGESVFDCHQVPSLSEKILCVFGIQITNSKNWPSKLCTKCSENTEQCYNYRKKYKLLEHSLHDMLKNRCVEIKNSLNHEYVNSLANSIDSSSSCVLSNYLDVNVNASANNLNYYSISTPHETKESLTCYGREGTKASSPGKLVSKNDEIFYIKNIEYRTWNDDKNVVIKIKPNDNEKKLNGSCSISNENYDQQDESKVNNILTFPNITNYNGQSYITEVFEESDFQKQVVSDDIVSTDEEEVSNCTPTKMKSYYPSVIVRPAYQQPNLQNIVHVFKFSKNNFTESEIHPQLMYSDETDDIYDQLNAQTDHEDRIGVLLLAAGVLNKEKSTIEVPKKQVSSDEKLKIKEKQGTIKRYSRDHHVQQQVKNIKVSSSVISKYRPVLHKIKLSPVEKKCTNCGVKNSTAWRRLKNDLVCNACGLYYNLHGKRRPEYLKRDTTLTRKRKI